MTRGRKPKLTEAQRAEIRDMADLRRQLTIKNMAKRFGVSTYVVAEAARGVEMLHHVDNPCRKPRQ